MPAEYAGRGRLEHRLTRGDARLFIDMFDQLGEAVTVRDLEGQLVYANHAALRQLGYESLAELQRRPTTAIMDEYIVEDERGRPFKHDAIPSVRLLRGDRVSPQVLHWIRRDTGIEAWNLLKTTALRDDEGELLGAVTVIEDMTAVKLAEIHMRILAESGRILASSLDYDQTLRNVVEVAVPALADYCGVDLLDDWGRLTRVAAAHRDPARRELVERLGTIGSVALDPDHRAARVLATGTSELFREIDPDGLDAIARTEHHRELLAELGLRSVVIVALGVRGRAIGVMTLGTNLGGRALRPDDVEIAEQLGRRSAAAVENARLYGKLSDVAETLQRALLPSALPEVPGWEIASLYAPTESELRIDIGGDFYELIEHEGTWFAIIGDVAGKGVAAASVTALMRHGARVACRSEPEPAMILTRLDEVLLQQDGGAMATAMCLCLDADHVVGSSAGHPPAILVGPDGALREAPRPDRMLGAFPDADARHDEPIPIAEGELLLIYTDGVTDAPGRHDRFGVVRLRQLLSELAGASPQRVLARLEQELRRFSPGPGRDDIAALAMRRRS